MLIDIAILPAYLAAATALTLAPGPDTMFVLATSAQGGLRAGVAATLGIASGCLVHAAMAALGISALIAASPAAFDALRLAGAIYLLWIGVVALRSFLYGLRGPIEVTASTGEGTIWRAYRRGAITNVLNPKVGIFYVAFLPQFANPALGDVSLQILLLASIHIALGVAWLGALSVASGRAAQAFARSSHVRTWLDGAAGAIYLALAWRMFVLERQEA